MGRTAQGNVNASFFRLHLYRRKKKCAEKKRQLGCDKEFSNFSDICLRLDFSFNFDSRPINNMINQKQNENISKDARALIFYNRNKNSKHNHIVDNAIKQYFAKRQKERTLVF